MIMLAMEILGNEMPVQKNEQEKFELSPEEKAQADEFLKEYEYVQNALFPDPFERIERHRNALNRVGLMNNKFLPYLKEKMFPKYVYDYSRICDSLAEEEDLDFIIDLIKDENVIRRQDGSALYHLCMVLMSFVRDIRKRNEEDERLEKIAEGVIELEKKAAIYGKTELAQVIALTGTKKAEEFLSQERYSDKEYLQKYFRDVSECRHIRRERFGRQNIHLVEEEYDPLNDEIDHWLDEYEEELEQREEWEEDDYDYDFRDPYLYENLPEQTKKYISVANSFVDGKEYIEETIRPVSKLVLFNEFNKNGNLGYFVEAASKIRKMNKNEKLYLGIQELPTIGIEVECDFYHLTREKVAILDGLDMPNYEEYVRDEENLHEVNANYSYSPFTQARVLEELAKFGAISRQSDENSKIYSLHINFGIPAELEGGLSYDEEVYNFVDAATFAFVSPKRILKRKTNNSVFILDADADGSKKYKGDYPGRLEYRANEFRNYSTFRMIAETQRLAAMLFSYEKEANNIETNELEKKLSSLWIEFSKRIEALRELHGISFPNLMDYNKHKVSEVLEKTDLQNDSRKLITEFSRKAMREIKEYYK